MLKVSGGVGFYYGLKKINTARDLPLTFGMSTEEMVGLCSTFVSSCCCSSCVTLCRLSLALLEDEGVEPKSTVSILPSSWGVLLLAIPVMLKMVIR